MMKKIIQLKYANVNWKNVLNVQKKASKKIYVYHVMKDIIQNIMI